MEDSRSSTDVFDSDDERRRTASAVGVPAILGGIRAADVKDTCDANTIAVSPFFLTPLVRNVILRFQDRSFAVLSPLSFVVPH